MIHATLQQLQQAIPGSELRGDATFTGLSTDSRQIAAGNCFVALRGEHFDAHQFLSQVQAAGAAAMVVEHVPEGVTCPVLIVPDTKQALLAVGRFWRQQFAIPVIGVTGSNGKTTVKEMIASILAAAVGAEHMLATRGNLNNEIGVPLTVLRFTNAVKAAVVELGMNHPGEIAAISATALPTVA